MEKRAFYDRKTKRATYSDIIRGGEVIPGAKIEVAGGPPAYGQKLAGKKGIDGAKRIMSAHSKK